MKEIQIKSIKKENSFVIGELIIDGNIEIIRTEICEEFIQYAVTDRIDAFVLGLLMFAIKNGYDFVSALPITDELKYNLERHLIPSLCNASKTFHHTYIKAPVTSPIKRIGEIVATGISCGVDSLYTILQHTQDSLPPSRRINSLAFFNIGSSMKGGESLRTPLMEGRFQLARNFAKEYGFSFLFIESNLHLIINKYVPYSHIENHTYMALFCLNIIAPCLKAYYYSSGYPYSKFTLYPNKQGELDCAHYDLLLMFCASIGEMKFYSAGSDQSRLKKTRALLDYEPAQKYLNVCVNEVKNDGICFKCIRTLLTIDALGGIDKFSKVFDIEAYKQKRFFYLKRLFLDAKFKNDEFYKEILPYYQCELTFFLKLKIFFSVLLSHLKVLFRRRN